MIIDYVNDNLDREKIANRLDFNLMNEIVELFDSCIE